MTPTLDTLAYTRSWPWDGSGVQVEQAMTAEEALRAGGLDFEVDHVPAVAEIPAKYRESSGASRYQRIRDRKAIIRTDTGAVLGVSGTVHKLYGNVPSFDLLDSLVEDGELGYEVVGGLRGGEIVYALARLLREYRIGGEPYNGYLFMRNHHDGRGSLTISLRNLRPYCANVVLGLAQASERFFRNETRANGGGRNDDGTYKRNPFAGTWRLRHTTNLEKKAEEARAALGLALDAEEQFVADGEAMLRRKMKERDFDRLLEFIYPTDGDDVSGRIRNANVERHVAIRDVWKNSENLENIRPTAWGAFNAIAEWTDHAYEFRGTKVTPKAESRFLSIMDDRGAAYTTKARALEALRSFEVSRGGIVVPGDPANN